MTRASYVESRRWVATEADDAIDTVVVGHEQVIYLGHGEWQSLADTPLE